MAAENGTQAFDIWACIQAVGSVVAIFAAIGLFVLQERQRNKEAREKEQSLAKAAGDIAREALVLVEARLNSALFTVGKPTLFVLRGHRTTEVVAALRELRISTLPREIISSVVRIRGGAYAVNARITDVFASEPNEKTKARRTKRLESSGRVLSETLDEFAHLRSLLANREIEIEPIIPDELTRSFMEASRKLTFSDIEAYD